MADPTHHGGGTPIPDQELQAMHVAMQTLGRVAIIGGGAMVAGTGRWLATALSCEITHQLSLTIPLISVLGVLLAAW